MKCRIEKRKGNKPWKVISEATGKVVASCVSEKTAQNSVDKRIDSDGKTFKEKLWFQLYIKYKGNATKAALEAFDCKNENVAGVIGYRMLRKHKITVEELMDKMGLTDAYLFNKLEEGMDAKKVELAKFGGRILHEKTYIDLPTRKQYLELALKVKGNLTEKIEIGPSEEWKKIIEKCGVSD